MIHLGVVEPEQCAYLIWLSRKHGARQYADYLSEQLVISDISFGQVHYRHRVKARGIGCQGAVPNIDRLCQFVAVRDESE